MPKDNAKCSAQAIVLDGHSHCGLDLPFDNLAGEWNLAGIQGGVIFSPVEEIYDRYDPVFEDSEEYVRSRARVHQYLIELAARQKVYPYFFVWNDFSSVPQGFSGIKWHRHAGEPIYHYGTERCHNLIEQICLRKLPVVLEEEFSNTLKFISRIDGRTVVIIPHMGALNGGYSRLKASGIFEMRNVWADTALASDRELNDFSETYGTDRIIFGSDYPFGIPSVEKRKVLYHFSGNDLTAILSGNLVRLLSIQPRTIADDGVSPLTRDAMV
jgi:uncharacterized protein